jgi:hypothetical protein
MALNVENRAESDLDKAGAPAITAEMVLAGKEEMSSRWIEFVHGPGHEELWDEVLSKVFRAMWKAIPR